MVDPSMSSISPATPQNLPVETTVKAEGKDKEIKHEVKGASMSSGHTYTLNFTAEQTKTLKTVTLRYHGLEKTIEIPESQRGKPLKIHVNTAPPNPPTVQKARQISQPIILTPEQTKNLEKMEIRHGDKTETIPIPKEWKGKQVSLIFQRTNYFVPQAKMATMPSQERAIQHMFAQTAMMWRNLSAMTMRNLQLKHQINELNEQTQQMAEKLDQVAAGRASPLPNSIK